MRRRLWGQSRLRVGAHHDGLCAAERLDTRADADSRRVTFDARQWTPILGAASMRIARCQETAKVE